MPFSLAQIATVLLLIASPFILIFCIYVWNWFMTDFLFLNGVTSSDYNKNTASKQTYKPIVYKAPVHTERTYLMPDERRNPPRAEFFGRLDGKYVITHGNYEEKYLNQYELGHWQRQKALNGTLEPISEAKPAQVADIPTHFEQNLEKSIDFT